MPLPEDFILTLKQNNPVESVMASYVQLKRSSRDYVCLCPFHSEKSPSCHVNVSGQYFHCFGCGAGGDVITFIMKQENLEYIEAVKMLAERAGMTMPDEAKNNDLSRMKARILEINRAAARYFNQVLTKEKFGEKGRLYFSSRQLSAKTITKYGLGYAPDDWGKLTAHLKSLGYSEQELVTANLARQSDRGGIYDSFRDRVMFPIIDLRGNVIAFGGRIIDGSGPKYLNSSDTPVFKKSRNLFSLNFAKKCDERRLILCEGYMDVIAVNQAGFENAVATLGTALTSEQARLMAQYADEVIICYDSDGAGQAATHKAINLLSEAGVKTRIINMTGAKDPDEFIKKFGPLRFKQLLDSSDGAVVFELRKAAEGIDLESDAGKVDYLKKCAETLSSINSPIERDIYISRVAKEQGVSKEALNQQVMKLIKKQMNAGKSREWTNIRTFSDRRSTAPEAMQFPREYKASEGILSFLIKNPDEVGFISENVTSDMMLTDFQKKLFEKLVDGMKNSSDFTVMSLQSELSADEMGKITAIMTNSEQIDINKTAASDLIKVLKEKAASGGEASAPSALSDDDFLKFAANLKKSKS